MDYFDTHVLMNLAQYQAAEEELTRVSKDFAEGTPEFDSAAGQAMVAAMNTATATYHMADHIFTQHAPTTPAKVYGTRDLAAYRDHLDKNRCIYIGNGKQIDDLLLLGAVVDAYKHFDLRNKARPVTSANATVVVATGYGKLPYGEGKYGGVAQVVVRLKDGRERALSKILQNVIEMWKVEIQTHNF